MTRFRDHLNTSYFKGELSTAVLTELDQLEGQRAEVKQFAERLCRLFCSAGIVARDVPLAFASMLTQVIPHVLPGAWDGMVPSITCPNRHVRIDRYLSGNRWWQPATHILFLDLGCGFPPVTSVDLAARFPLWLVIALDRAVWPYMVIDTDGNRGVFDQTRTLRYFQPQQPSPTGWRRILQNKEGTKARLTFLLQQMLQSHRNEEYSSFVSNGARLVTNPTREYERANLRFREGDLLSPDLPFAEAARCFNVLTYFDDAFRQKALANVSSILTDGAIFITGVDWAETMLARYLVYRKEGNKLVAREFAFTLDYLRGSTSYFTLHDDDEEARQLVAAIHTLRQDRGFFTAFSARFDALHAEHGVCPRNPDGYLGDFPDVSGAELIRRNLAIIDAIEEEGYVDKAVAALKRGGFDAWRNEAGHVALSPRGKYQ